jgi:hypothetical protein
VAQREDYLLRTLHEHKTGARRSYDPDMASVVEPLGIRISSTWRIT